LPLYKNKNTNTDDENPKLFGENPRSGNTALNANRPQAKSDPLADPNADIATKSGIIQTTPGNTSSAQVYSVPNTQAKNLVRCALKL